MVFILYHLNVLFDLFTFVIEVLFIIKTGETLICNDP